MQIASRTLLVSFLALAACGAPIAPQDGSSQPDVAADRAQSSDGSALDATVSAPDASAMDSASADVATVPDVSSPDVNVTSDAGCSGTPTSCVSGTPGGLCGDGVLLATCVANAWVCPPATIPISECGCVGRPPSSSCTCVNRMWSCPSSDAGADARADAAASTFACGTLSCTSGVEYCVRTLPGVPGAMATYACEALPRACFPTPSCRCLPPIPGGAGSCSESSAGDITVTIALP